jgi:adenine-specific DNA methylase
LLSAECQGDNNARQRPPQNRLHIWWVRRPPTICRAAILANLLRPYQPGRQGACIIPRRVFSTTRTEIPYFFQGSVNETGAAWTRNQEKFEVKRSWYSPQDAEDIQYEITEFETI